MSILKLKDESIENIEFDKIYYKCNDIYVTHLIINLCNKNIEVIVRDKDKFLLTEGYMMKLFIDNLNHITQITEKEFFNWLEKKLRKDFNNMYYDYY